MEGQAHGSTCKARCAEVLIREIRTGEAERQPQENKAQFPSPRSHNVMKALSTAPGEEEVC